MITPICDFVHQYVEKQAVRLHMPGHKGQPFLGPEPLDITEIDGADNLFSPTGIIAQSEKNAGKLFGAHTFYSTGGSTLAIQAMLTLTAFFAKAQNKNPVILAGRNVHKAFIHAAALLNITVVWLYPENSEPYYSGKISAKTVAKALKNNPQATAVYLTGPDYLGQLPPLQPIAEICHKNNSLLLVDNAHGAYLNFLPTPCHPMALGADLCCDSAHKTLPVLTGGAYLHINLNAPELLTQNARTALSVFGSSSPSYLILQSLDRANIYLQSFAKALESFVPKVSALKNALQNHGFSVLGEEPLKITLAPKQFGYTGTKIAHILQKQNIVPEFYDSDYVVFMLSPQNTTADLNRLQTALCNLKPQPAIQTTPPPVPHPPQCLPLNEALLQPGEQVALEQAVGRICAAAVISCPPAVPIAVCGEQLNEAAISTMRYYGLKSCTVVKKQYS